MRGQMEVDMQRNTRNRRSTKAAPEKRRGDKLIAQIFISSFLLLGLVLVRNFSPTASDSMKWLLSNNTDLNQVTSSIYTFFSRDTQDAQEVSSPDAETQEEASSDDEAREVILPDIENPDAEEAAEGVAEYN